MPKTEHKPGDPFPGLKLKKKDRKQLVELKRIGALRERDWRRVRILELLDEGWNLTAIGKALSTWPREVRRVGWRYLTEGLEAALNDDPRPFPARILDHAEESAVVALVCSPPPEGRARWTIRLVAAEAVRRGIVKRAGREKIRLVLAEHALKPWREKNVVRAGAERRVHRAHGGRVGHSGAAAKPEGAGSRAR